MCADQGTSLNLAAQSSVPHPSSWRFEIRGLANSIEIDLHNLLSD